METKPTNSDDSASRGQETLFDALDLPSLNRILLPNTPLKIINNRKMTFSTKVVKEFMMIYQPMKKFRGCL